MSRRWNRFSLRAALVFVFVCAVLCGLWTAYVEPYRREHRAAAKMRAKDVQYVTEALGPSWLHPVAEGKFAQRVVEVHFGQDVTDEDLSRLASFRHLRAVMVTRGTAITNQGLSDLVSLPGLESLMLDRTRVTNDGFKELQRAKGLRSLWISSDQLTDDSLRSIGTLTELRELGLEADVTDRGMRHLALLKKLETLRCLSTDPNVRKIQSSLSSPVRGSIVSASLADVCTVVTDFSTAPIRFDDEAFQAAGFIPRELAVTLSLDGPLGEEFESGLAQHSLVYRVKADGVVVTTASAAEKNQRGLSALKRALPSLKKVEVWW